MYKETICEIEYLILWIKTDFLVYAWEETN